MSISRRNLYIISALIVVAGIVLILSGIDMGGGIVRDQAVKAAQRVLKADLMINDVRGNPFKGYRIKGVEVIRDGESLLAFDQISVKPRVFSLLSGSPRISLIGIKGFQSNIEKINSIINSLEPEGGGGENPIEKLQITDSLIDSEWARMQVNNILMEFSGNIIRNDLDLKLNDLPVKGALNIIRDGDDLGLDKLDLSVGEGEVAAEGSLLPGLSVNGQIRELDLTELLSFWPEADSGSYEGKLSSSLEAEGSWEKPNISGELVFKGSKVAGFPMNNASSRWRYRDNRLDVAGLTADPLGIPLKGDLAFVFRDAVPAIMVDLEADSVNLTSLKGVSPQLESVEGMIDKVKVKLQGSVSEPDGQIQLKASRVELMGYPIENSDIDVKISRGNMQLKGRSEYSTAPVTFSGSVATFMTMPVLDIKGNFRSLNMEKLHQVIPALGNMQVKGMLDGDIKISGKADATISSGKIWSGKLNIMKEDIIAPSTFFNFGKDSLTLSDTRASWRGAKLSGGGLLSGLSTDSRKIDMQIGAEELDSAFIEKFAPAVSAYSLKGKISVKAAVKGILPDPGINIELFSGSLGLMEQYLFSDLRISTSFPRVPKEIPEDIALTISATSASLAQVPVNDLMIKLGKTGNAVKIEQGKVLIGDGSVNASGQVVLAEKGKDPDLDIIVKASAIDLGVITSSAKDSQPVTGSITGEITVKGPLSDPAFTVKGSSPSITAGGMRVEDLSASLGGNMSLVKIEKLQAKAGGGTLNVSGEVKPKTSIADLSLKGTGLDLSVLTAGFPQASEMKIAGKADIDFSGHFEEGKNTGSGSVTSSEMQAMGIRATGISYPVSLKGDTLSVTDGKAMLYGGTVKGDGTLDIRTMKFYKNVEVSGTDVDAMLKDAFKIKGNITGKAQLFAKIDGSMADGLSYEGKGLLKTGEGEISGFKGVTLAAALYGLKSIRYRSVYAPFDIRTGNIVLQEETEVTAYETDPLYRYLRATGQIGPESGLDLLCKGNLNIQILNILLGGVSGGLGAERSLEGLFQGIVKGAGQQAGKEDFRDASFRLGGTFQKPEISGVKIAAPEEPEKVEQPVEELPKEEVIQLPEQVKPEQPEATQEVEEKKDTEEQIKDEIMKQIFKN